MDYDNLDYFPRRGKPTTRVDEKGEWTKEQNLKAMRESGLAFHEVKNGDVCVFRQPGKPTVDFFTRKNRWQIRGQKKTTHGTVSEFRQFIARLWGEPVTRTAPSKRRPYNASGSLSEYGLFPECDAAKDELATPAFLNDPRGLE